MVGPFRFATIAVVAGFLIVSATQQTAGQQPPAPAAPAQAQPPTDAPPPADSSQTQTPTFRSGVNFVRVDVTITDKSGKPIDDLKPEDFEVTEAGKLQKVETFKLISLDGGLMAGPEPPTVIRTDADEQTEAARDDVRLFGLFLDEYHVKRDSSLAMRQQLARFIETQLGPSDMLGVMSPLAALASVRFGRNHDAVRRALLQFQGRKYDYRPVNDAEARYVYMSSPEQIERVRNQISFSAIKALIMQMGSLKEGRKALILVSEGYTNILPPQLQSQSGGIINSGVPSAPPIGGMSTVGSTRELFDSMDIQMDFHDIFALAARNNVAIYTVDPRGLAASEFGMDLPSVDQRTDSMYLNMTMDTLRDLAQNTDGRFIVNRNDITLAMKQIVIDSSAYYLLGYNSSVLTADGKFHPIKVELTRAAKARHPGADVRSRPGYWALRPEEAARAAAAAAGLAAAAPPPSVVETAMRTALTPRSRVIRTWIGTERGEAGKTRVTFVWEPMPGRAGEAVRPGDRPARVLVTAVSADGAPYFRGRVPDGAAAGAAAPTASAASASTGARVTFDATPGPMQLRLSVEGADAGVVDSETRDITIPDLSSPQTTFATPELFRARTLPELQQLKSNPRPIPTANREFIRTDRLVLRAMVYGPAGSSPAVTAVLLNRAGQKMSDLPVVAPDAASAVRQVEVTLANLTPGDYAVTFNATGDGGDARELVPFRLIP